MASIHLCVDTDTDDEGESLVIVKHFQKDDSILEKFENTIFWMFFGILSINISVT